MYLPDPRGDGRFYDLVQNGESFVVTGRSTPGQTVSMGHNLFSMGNVPEAEARATFERFVAGQSGVHPGHIAIPGDPVRCAIHQCAMELHYHEPPVVDWRCPQCWAEGKQ